MLITEDYKTRSDGVKLIRTYSDEGRKLIRNDGVVYDEAIDIEGAPYTYTESEEFNEVVEELQEEIVEYRIIPETITEDLAFAMGEKGWWKGELYESLYDNQTWNPEQFAAGWMKVITE